MVTKRAKRDSFEYDVCLSFAGEDRAYVEQVAEALAARGVRVFYDVYERVDLWGKDLYVHLADVYQNRARYCVLFASRHYAKKVWTSHERQNAQARAIREAKEYILPARLDTTEVPGLPDTVGFVSLKNTSPVDLAEMIVTKVGRRHRELFLPKNPDRLYQHIRARNRVDRALVFEIAEDYIDALKLMTNEEKRILTLLVYHGCPAGPPENVHISLDRLRRLAKLPAKRVAESLGSLRSLGFGFSVGSPHPDADEDSEPAAIVEFNVNTDYEPPLSRPDLTQIAVMDAMVRSASQSIAKNAASSLSKLATFHICRACPSSQIATSVAVHKMLTTIGRCEEGRCRAGNQEVHGTNDRSGHKPRAVRAVTKCRGRGAIYSIREDCA